MWLYRSGNYGRKFALYEYQPSRSSKHAKKFLECFHCFLQSDDYSEYNSVGNITRVGFLAHARRYYSDALKILTKESEIESTHTHRAIEYFREMFRLKSKWKDLSPQQRQEIRNIELKPVLEAYLS